MNNRDWSLNRLRSEIAAVAMSLNPDTTEQVRCCDCDFTTTVYSDEVRAFYRFHQCWPPPERAILTDLIAELRGNAGGFPGATGRWLRAQADRAEARLREVQGE